eukprot:TRINITY_DN190_c0_g1_i1.p1 TRINITY_DN190_c0_g1~~TRINITY_DN190_c0_g1_i1.p1  ORF type:complete len:230 (+),score=76.88 TRINITY_DN190_c0_g1_i1:29-691(+)
MLGSVHDHDEVIAKHARRLKRVLMVLMVISIVSLMLNPMSLLSFAVNALLLTIAFVGAHKRNTSMLLAYASVKATLLALSALALVVAVIALGVMTAEMPQPDYDEVHMDSPTFVAYTAFVAAATLLAVAYLALVVRAIRLSLRLRAHILARRFLADFEEMPSKVAQPVPMPVQFPGQPMPMPFPVHYPGQPMPVGQPIPMYPMVPAVPLPQDVTPQPSPQ